jgi:hypothetical protein
MPFAVIAIFLITLLFTAETGSAEAARGARGSGGLSERAARAEARSREQTMAICRGCGVSSPKRVERVNVASGPRPRSKARSTTLWTPIPALPLLSRAEAQVGNLNQAMDQQRQRVEFQQQIQFELNQLRSEIQRDYLFPRWHQKAELRFRSRVR